MQAQIASNLATRMEPSVFSISAGLSLQGASRLMAVSSLHHKAPGETLFSEGDEADSVYEVVRGMLRLCKLLPDGRRQITGFLSAGQFLGLAPEGVCVYTAEAITEVTLCRYKRSAFDRLIDEMPGFAKRVLAVASHELSAAQNQMLLLGRKAAVEKVASFLLLMAEQAGEDEDASIGLPMTRNDIADYLGLTIETVSRTLTKLKQDRLIALPTPDRIKIRNRDQLKELAGGEADQDF
jgi:CRP/FNR family transcriptional regulator, anaerobic regulatory protein